MKALALAAASALLAQAPAPLATTVFDWTQLTAKPTAKGERRDIVNRPTATFANLESHVTSLRAGEESHAPHRHADEEIIVVKEGTLEVRQGERLTRAPAGSMIFFASGDLHGLRNAGEGMATYYVIRIVTGATPKSR